jgi:hypothetical protein
VTGDAPQPGETPRHEVEPWAFADPDPSWWRGETDRADDHAGRSPLHRAAPELAAAGGTGVLLPPGYDRPPVLGPELPGVAEAQLAAARDVAEKLDPATGVERHHDQADPFRYDPRPEPAVGEDVMVLPELNPRNRPTVALDRGSVPGQPPAGRTWQHPGEPLPRPTGTPATDARLEKLENSPFWLSEQERAAAPPAAGAAHTRRGPRHATRRTVPALVALIVLALLSTFFAWVSAEPFWIAVGHGDPGYATTAHCAGSGVTQRCTGTFAAADGDFAVSRVTLLGVAGEQRADGAIAPARMVSADSGQAYLGDTGVLIHLRWMLGFLLVLICGYAIAGLTGARRLETARARRGAVLVSLAGPLILLAGFLLAAY